MEETPLRRQFGDLRDRAFLEGHRRYALKMFTLRKCAKSFRSTQIISLQLQPLLNKLVWVTSEFPRLTLKGAEGDITVC